MDLLFRTYADPFTLLDQMIPAGQFVNFLKTFTQKNEEKYRWEFYLHKLSAWDERTWEEFNHDLDFGTAKGLERPSDQVLTDTVKESYNIMKNFNPEGRG
jgi:hypothetical protein